MRLQEWLRNLFAVEKEYVYYIGGAEVLPPPLKGSQEQEALVSV